MKIRVRLLNILLYIIGVLFIFIFSFPLGLNCSMNIGIATGTLLGIIIVVYGLFLDYINAFVKKLWKKRIGKAFLSFCIVGVCSGIVLVGVESYLIISAENKKPDTNTTVIILGCRVYGTRPSAILQTRMDVAIDYLEENEGAYVIVSGGKGDDEDISEAACMENYLIEHGISKERIIVEDKSKSTQENFEYSKKLMEKKGLEMKLAVATSDFHQYRASIIGKEYGIETSAISAQTAKPFMPAYFLREIYGVLYQWII